MKKKLIDKLLHPGTLHNLGLVRVQGLAEENSMCTPVHLPLSTFPRVSRSLSNPQQVSRR